MVAAVLLAIGLGAAMASSRAAVRLAEAGGRRALAAAVAAAALDTAALTCADGRRGGPSGLEAYWTLSGSAPWTAIEVVVHVPSGAGADTVRVGGAAGCVR